jgi:phosphatidylglycerophosphate synthase
MSSLVSPGFRDRVRSGIEQPVGRFFARTRLSPNALTLIGFGIAIVAAAFAATQSWLVAGLLVAFGAVFDLFDGALARATGKTSRFGAFMDSTFDRAGEAVVYIGIGLGLTWYDIDSEYAISPLLAILVVTWAMAAAFMVSYTRAKSESLGFASGSGMAKVGLAPREVRTALLVLGLVATGTLGLGLGDGGYQSAAPVLMGTLGLIALLATLTTIQRIYHVYSQSKKEQQ